MKSEVVCGGIPFGEGPVWCDDGTLVVTSVAAGALFRVWPDESRSTRFTDTGGGANGAALAADGSVVVTQNGGFDFSATGLFPDPPPYRPNAVLRGPHHLPLGLDGVAPARGPGVPRAREASDKRSEQPT